ncbi:MAG TPA: hypothetical protein VN666_04475 [Nitrospira sp.]|nr:hypothetical protein [Nitrospira sp.]
MSLTKRLGQMERKITELTGKPGEQGTTIILRHWRHAPDAVLIGYRHSTGILPLDRTHWPHVPAGTRMFLREVWSDHETYRAEAVQS